jgi:hypothetical protein
MKRQFLILIAITVFATAFTTNAFGQTSKTVRTNVKFDFQIEDHIYPAGEYQIESISGGGDNLLLIKSVGDTNNNRFIIANHLNAGKRQAPTLVFQKCGGSYFLTRIFLDAGQWGYSIRPSRRQRESEKDLALASLEKH